MANMTPNKTNMPVQDPEVRNKNFSEVATGYTEEMARAEAARCLGCKNKPCVSGCPVNVKIPEFVALVAAGKFQEAYRTIRETNDLPAVCGRVCPQEVQCEMHCVRGIKGEPVGIGRLERFCADWAMDHLEDRGERVPSNGHKAAVLGAGPSGLTCAGDLRKLGYDVTVFEAFHKAGGVLIYGIPEFRLPKAIVQKEVDKLLAAGVELRLNAVVGKAISVDELFEEGFEAVFIGTGAGLPMFMNIPGEGLNGVFSANEYLTRNNLMKAFDARYDTPMIAAKNVAVVGGGNVAMDAARTAKRLGARVTVVYRRSEKELPARREEVEHAMEEGIDFRFLCSPVEILGDENGWVRGMECVEMELGEPDQSGRRRPVVKEGSKFALEVDAVIMSIGTSPNPIIKNTTQGLTTDKRGCIVAEEGSGQTSRPGVFAGGDAVTGAATVILAMGAGKTAARHMDEYIRHKHG